MCHMILIVLGECACKLKVIIYVYSSLTKCSRSHSCILRQCRAVDKTMGSGARLDSNPSSLTTGILLEAY